MSESLQRTVIECLLRVSTESRWAGDDSLRDLLPLGFEILHQDKSGRTSILKLSERFGLMDDGSNQVDAALDRLLSPPVIELIEKLRLNITGLTVGVIVAMWPRGEPYVDWGIESSLCTRIGRVGTLCVYVYPEHWAKPELLRSDTSS